MQHHELVERFRLSVLNSQKCQSIEQVTTQVVRDAIGVLQTRQPEPSTQPLDSPAEGAVRKESRVEGFTHQDKLTDHIDLSSNGTIVPTNDAYLQGLVQHKAYQPYETGSHKRQEDY